MPALTSIAASGRHAAGRPRARAAITSVLCLLAVVSVARTVTAVLSHRKTGLDFRPLYDAGLAERWHEPLYSVADFVYPPPAAWVFAPLSSLAYRTSLEVFTALGAAALVATCLGVAVVVTGPAHRRWTLACAALLVAVLFATRPTRRTLGLDNLSVFLPLVLLAVAWCWGRGRWWAGTALLVASLVLKPVLLALVLLPLVHRRWRPLLACGAVGGLVCLVATTASAGTSAVGTVVDALLHARQFTGRSAPLNLSLQGFALDHDVPTAVSLGARAAVVAVALLAVVAWARRTAAGDDLPVTSTLAASTTATAALMLAGSISEVHYVLVLVPGTVAVLATRRPLASGLAGAAALAFLLAERSGFHPQTQSLLVATQLLALAAGAAHVLRRPSAASAAAAQNVRTSLPRVPPASSTR